MTTLILRASELTEEEGQAITTWQYPEPYHRYGWPPWETMLMEGYEFGNASVRQRQYLAVHPVQHNELVGFLQLFPLGNTIRLGMGLRPDCCGQGWGAHLISLALEEALRRQPNAEIDLEVEIWNRRAIRTYEKAGFTLADEYERPTAQGATRVFCMVWNNNY